MSRFTFGRPAYHRLILIGAAFMLFGTLALWNPSKTSADSNVEVTMITDLERRLTNNPHGSIAYNGEFYLLATYEGDLLRSKDGRNWNSYGPEAIYSDGIQDGFAPVTSRKLVWDGKQFICMMDRMLYTSSDGDLWKPLNIPHPDPSKEYHFRDLVVAGDKYVMVAQEFPAGVTGFASPGPNTFFYGTDITKLRRGTKENMTMSISGERPIENLAWNGKTFIGGGNASVLSTDGIRWKGFYGSYDGYGYVWDGKRFWAAFQGDVFAVDPQGKSQARIQVQDYQKTDVHLATMGFNGSEYLAGGYLLGGTENDSLLLFHSLDGKKWNKIEVKGGGSGIEVIFPTHDGFLLLGSKLWYFENKKLNKPSSWAESDIQKAQTYGLISPRLSSFYRSNVTRQEFSELSVRIYETFTGKAAAAPSSNPFVDTTDPYVLKANALGIARGRTANAFAPNDPVTRQDISVMIHSTLKAAGIDAGSSGGKWQKDYTDADQVAGYALPSLKWLNEAAILNGKDGDRIVPRGYATREEAIVMMMRLIDKFNPRPDALVPVQPEKPAEPELTPIEKASQYLMDKGYSVKLSDRSANYLQYEIRRGEKVVFLHGYHPQGDEYSDYNSWVQIETLPHLDPGLVKDAQEFVHLLTGTTDTGLADAILRQAAEAGYVYESDHIPFMRNGLDLNYYILDRGDQGRTTNLLFNR